jgi:hypothetical protein
LRDKFNRSFDIGVASYSQHVKSSFTFIDSEVTRVTPCGAPLILTNPVESVVVSSIIVPSNELNSMTTESTRARSYFVDTAAIIVHEVIIDNKAYHHWSIVHDFLLDLFVIS